MAKLIENVAIWIAFHAPRRIAYWCSIRMAVSDGIGGTYPDNPGERTCANMLKSHSGWAH